MNGRILVADDDYLLRDLLRDVLESKGYEVAEASDGEKALEYFKKHSDLSLIVLDVMMPKKDGWNVLREIRRTSEIPVIMLTALGGNRHEVEGFRLGACDYVAKPFHTAVLLARIQAALRFKVQEDDGFKWKAGELLVDTNACCVSVKGQDAALTNKEYQLLLYLMENKNIVLTRDQILERIWGFDYEGDIRTIDTHIKMLRTDLGSCGEYIRTVRGIGYVFKPEDIV